MPEQNQTNKEPVEPSNLIAHHGFEQTPSIDVTMTRTSRSGPQGTARTRAQVNAPGQRILDFAAEQTIREAAARMGLDYFDLKNLRAGNQASLNMVLKLITIGYFNPEELLTNGQFVTLKGRARSRVRGLTKAMISEHIRKLSASRPAKDWSRLTGLTPASIYQLRKIENRSAYIPY